MPEPRLDDLGMHSLLQHEARRRVAEIVEPDVGQAGPPEKLLECRLRVAL